MAKKKAEATQAPQTSGTQNGANQNGTQQPKIRSATVQAVKDCLDRGVESPTEIVATLKGQGIEVSPNYVSLIKGKFRTGGKKKGKKRGPKPKAAAQPAAAQSTTAPVKRAATNGAGLSPQDLAGLAELVGKAGGAANLRAYLTVLERIR